MTIPNVEAIADGVFQLKNPVGVLDQSMIDMLISDCKSNIKKRSRINFHQSSSDLVQEMIIAMHRDTDIFVHKHLAKSESFHVLHGEIAVVLFSGNSPDISQVVNLNSSVGTNYYRLSCDLFHLVVPLTEVSIIHETTQGPFEPNSAQIADWSLSDSGNGIVKSIKQTLLRK